jgi:hypothetical protein
VDQEEQAGRPGEELKASSTAMRGTINRQGGWVGMIVLLLAVVIVAFLAKDALMKYGLLAPGQTTVKGSATPGERTQSGAAGDVERADPAGAGDGDRPRARRRGLRQAAGKQARRQLK